MAAAFTDGSFLPLKKPRLPCGEGGRDLTPPPILWSCDLGLTPGVSGWGLALTAFRQCVVWPRPALYLRHLGLVTLGPTQRLLLWRKPWGPWSRRGGAPAVPVASGLQPGGRPGARSQAPGLATLPAGVTVHSHSGQPSGKQCCFAGGVRSSPCLSGPHASCPLLFAQGTCCHPDLDHMVAVMQPCDTEACVSLMSQPVASRCIRFPTRDSGSPPSWQSSAAQRVSTTPSVPAPLPMATPAASQIWLSRCPWFFQRAASYPGL